MIGQIDEVVFDCADPEMLVWFWSRVLGGDPVRRDDSWWYVIPPGWTQLSFQKVPEVRTVKNRLHLDVAVANIDRATEQAEAIGAARLGVVHHSRAGSFQVLHDPEGNEWCLVRPADT